MAKSKHHPAQLAELLQQALETELGGVKVYTAAISCAINDDLREEWEGYLMETQRHRDLLIEVFSQLGLDPGEITPGREVVAHLGDALVRAIEMARDTGDAAAAQIVAAECVVLAETKDHLNWELLGLIAAKGTSPELKAIKEVQEQVEQEEDHHLFHTEGWTRELWIEALGLPAVLPPPEEVKNVETRIGASRARNARDEMLRRKS